MCLANLLFTLPKCTNVTYVGMYVYQAFLQNVITNQYARVSKLIDFNNLLTC